MTGSDSVPTSPSKLNAVSAKANSICFYCKKPGHKISECFILSKKAKSTKPVGLTVASHFPVEESVESLEFQSLKFANLGGSDCLTDYAPFLTTGVVSTRARRLCSCEY